MIHEEFEKIVMDKILDCQDDVFHVLKKQYAQATVISRKFTGCGFFTSFSIPDELAIDSVKGEIHDVFGTFKDNPNETYMFILFIDNGKIDALEGVSFFDWCYDYDKLNLDYGLDDKRDFYIKK